MTVPAVLDSAAVVRSPATMPGYHPGRAPRNTGLCYAADPPTVEEIVAVIRGAGEDRHRWRCARSLSCSGAAGLRVQEAPALTERDLDRRRRSLLVRQGRAYGGGRSAWTWGWENYNRG